MKRFYFFLLFSFVFAQDIPEDQTPEKAQKNQEVLKQISQAPKDHNEAIERFVPHKQSDRKHREKIKLISTQELQSKMQACQEKNDLKTCFEAGMIFYQGRSAYGQDLQEAFYHLEKSCQGSDALGCYEAGIIAANTQSQISSAQKLLDRSCNSGDLRGCKNLAILYYNGLGVAKNQYKALEIWNSNCNKGDSSSCQKFYYTLGYAYEKSQNLIGAKIHYEKGCSYGDELSCRTLKRWGVQFSLKSPTQSPKQGQHKLKNSPHNLKMEQQSL
ncbi:tetratricopeptide repeat protein [Helicobacter cholecystus]|uniref:tetratricopeptide repeat protein n=1 Tax=Helicobacter cholecystus TaxID=45498 RepID=UPI000F6D9F5E|nr:tetratricopeptide repeat protein [Helicobacter cholecystus]VEJ24073.1 cysteine-rich protein H [Helicobacter cholecystus]